LGDVNPVGANKRGIKPPTGWNPKGVPPTPAAPPTAFCNFEKSPIQKPKGLKQRGAHKKLKSPKNFNLGIPEGEKNSGKN